jgi:hypothetical protein
MPSRPPTPHRLAGYVREAEAAPVSSPPETNRRGHLSLVPREKPDLYSNLNTEPELIRDWPWPVAGAVFGLLLVAIFMLAKAGVL